MNAPSPPRAQELSPYLRCLAEAQGSDLFLTTGCQPAIKVDGAMRRLNMEPLAPGGTRRLAYSAMSETQVREFERDLECDFALALPGIGRFRINVFQQRGEVGLAVRLVRELPLNAAQLKLPPVTEWLALLPRGLVLVVGAAGSGKSTTLAAMVDHRNRNMSGHILTIEDPIEFLHPHRQCVVEQREVGLDTRSFHEALRHALRETPDLIVIGEIRDADTMEHALHYAETGHLCMATLHATNASQAIERMVNFFPEPGKHRVLTDIGRNLGGIVAQRLVRGRDGHRVVATEVLLHSAFIQELVQKGEIDRIREAIAASEDQGMHGFDESLYQLFACGDIDAQEALDQADSRTEMALRMRLRTTGLPDTAGMTLKPR